MDRVTAIIFAVVVAGLAAVGVGLATSGLIEHQSFKAFYCAGAAIDERRDPYRVEPLRSCEVTLASDVGKGIVEPAPLPGYTLALFALLARVPAGAAAVIFALLSIAAVSVSAACIAAVVRISPVAVLLAFAPLTMLNLAYGETPPFAILGLCLSAYFLMKNQMTAAGLAVSAALIQPNIGLAAAVALFVFQPRSRLALALCALAFATVSIAAIGFNGNIEYFRSVLPLQEASELVASDQYSLSRLLFEAGVPAGLCLLLGKIWFGILAIAGIVIARYAAERTKHAELLVLLPPAIGLLWGIYLHDIQILFAVPAALVVATIVREAHYRALALIALALLITVWTQHLGRAAMFFDFLGVAAGIFAVSKGSLAKRMAGASFAGVAILLLILLAQHVEAPTGSGQVAKSISSAPDDFAPQAWATFLRSSPGLMVTAFVLKIPTWLGLLGIIVSGIHLGARYSTTGSFAREVGSLALD